MNDSNPLVSIIVACHNAEECMDDCFKSLLEQTYQNFEIVVCDDCSTDNSYEKLLEWTKNDKRFIVLKNDKNIFAAQTRNNCFKASHGEYYLIQDIDDLSEKNRIERLMEVLLSEKDKIDYVSSQMSAFNSDPKDIFMIMEAGPEYPTKKDFLLGLPFHHPATLFTKKCIDAVNGYRVAEETRKGQDYDLFMRLYARGFIGKNIRESLYLFRLDAANIKRRDFKGRIWEYKIRKYGFKEMGLMPWAFPFTLKPFAAHFVQKIKFASILKNGQ